MDLAKFTGAEAPQSESEIHLSSFGDTGMESICALRIIDSLKISSSSSSAELVEVEHNDGVEDNNRFYLHYGYRLRWILVKIRCEKVLHTAIGRREEL